MNHNSDEASVTLSYSCFETDYIVDRRIVVSGKRPRRQITTETLNLRRDGVELSRTEAEAELRRVFPPRLAGFYLFDGEQLAAYERDLRGGSTASRPGRPKGPGASRIRTDIERLMGLPAIQNTATDLAVMLREADRTYSAKLGKAANKSRDMARATALNDEIERLETNHAELLRDLQASIERLRHLDELRAQTEELHAILGERDALNDQVRECKGRQSDLLRLRADLSTHVWRCICLPLGRRILAEDNSAIEALQATEIRRERLRAELAELNAGIEQHRCPTCHQVVEASSQKEIEQRMFKIKAELESSNGHPSGSIDFHQLRRSKMNAFLDPADREFALPPD